LYFRFLISDFRLRARIAAMNEEIFLQRTKKFGLAAIRLVSILPHGTAAEIMGKQLLRAATSVGANYRAACRAKSAADMIAKLKIVEEESDESVYWLELLAESGIIPSTETDALRKEGNEIVAMTSASIKTMRARSSTSLSRQA
jgi:four helix bundle protein